MSERRQILIFIDWFYPAFKAGGPVKSVYNIIKALANQYDFSIVTSAYDLNEDSPLDGIICNKWVKYEDYKVIYLTKPYQTRSMINKVYNETSPDLVYFNSLFSLKFTLFPLFTLPVDQKKILAPRGMLGAEALQIKKYKKGIFLAFMKRSNRFKQLKWHASTVLEKREIEHVFGEKANIYIAQNVATLATRRPEDKVYKTKGKLNLIFFSRINEKKNLLYALDVLKQIGNNNICLDVYGPIEDAGYWEKCQVIIKKDNLNVRYQGILKPEEIPNLLWNYDFLFLPTLHENYGHVIAESLCSCLPIIISKNTPWLNLEDKKLGYDFNLDDKEKFINQMKELLNQTKEEYLSYISSTFEYSKEHIVNKEIVVENRKMLEHA